MEAAKRVAKNTGFLYARMIITVFISLYSTRLILKALGADDFGIYNLVGGAIAMLTFLNSAMAAATQRFMSYAQGEGNTEKQKNIFNVSVVLHFVIGFSVVIILEIGGYFLFNGVFKIDPTRIFEAKLIYQFMLVSTFFTIITVPYDAVINARENMLWVAIVGVVNAVIRLGIAIYITYTSFDHLISYGLLMALMSILLLIVTRIYCHINYEEVIFNVKKYFDKSLFKEMTSFAGWAFIASTTNIIANYGQGIILNTFFGTIVNAAQGVANQVRGQLGAFAVSMLQALNPVIAKSEGAGDRNMMLNASMKGSKVSFFLLMFFYVPVLLEMPMIFKLWLTDVPEYAIIFCRLILFRSLIVQIFQTLPSSISAVGNIKNFTIYSSIFNVFPLVVSYIVFSLGYPPYALYIVYIIYSILSSVIILYFAKKECNLSIPLFLKEVVFRSVASFLIVFALSALPTLVLKASYVRLLLVLLISSASFLFTIWFIGFNSKERKQILTAVREINLKNILRKKVLGIS